MEFQLDINLPQVSLILAVQLNSRSLCFIIALQVCVVTPLSSHLLMLLGGIRETLWRVKLCSVTIPDKTQKPI